jgi:uncharacterized membrane protein
MLTFLVIVGVVVVLIRVSSSTNHVNKKLEQLENHMNHRFESLVMRVRELEERVLPNKREAEKPKPEPKPEPKAVFEPPPMTPVVPPLPAAEAAQMLNSMDMVEPYETYQPSEFEKFLSDLPNRIVNYFRTGNTPVKVGVVILFFGVSFLLKYAVDRGFVPIQLRLIGAALGGIALTQLGWHLRNKKENYALVLQGGGVGVLFITVFAALRLYHLIPAALAFFVLVSLTGITGWMAVLQNSKALAAFGATGGFLAPILSSTGQGNHVVLFSFYAVLNAGIFGVAWFKSWRILNLLGFAFTFVIGTTWGVLKYNPEHFATTEPFLILFFLMYVAIPILHAKKQTPELKGYVDGTLVFGNAIISFGLQSQLVRSYEYATAFSALAVSVLYMFIARVLYSGDKNLKMLFEAFLSLGVIFGTLTIPLAFDGHWTAAVWAIEAAGIYWVCVRQKRQVGRIFSMLLLAGAGTSFLLHHDRGALPFPFLNSFYIGCLLVAAGSFAVSYIGYRNQDQIREDERSLMLVFFIFSMIWWVVGGYVEIERNFILWWNRSGLTPPFEGFPHQIVRNVSFAYVTLGTLLSTIVGRRIRWSYLSNFGFVLLPFMYFECLRQSATNVHPTSGLGWFVWPLSFAVYYGFIRGRDSSSESSLDLIVKGAHAGTLWLLTILGTWELYWQVHSVSLDGESWAQAAMGVFPFFILVALFAAGKKGIWPVGKHWRFYLTWGAGPIIASAWVWVFLTNFLCAGDARPLPYIPILNPLEIIHGLFMLLLPVWFMKLKAEIGKEQGLKNTHIGGALGFTYFFWMNGILMRAIHHFSGIPYRFGELFASVLVQASLSIYWSLIGISLMIAGSRKRLRWLWISGASLMGVVVVKLFLIDLSKTGTVERIISFLSVGILLLVVGYFSPIPPKGEES